MSPVSLFLPGELSQSRREILRYAGAKAGEREIENLLDSCLKESQGHFSYRACYRILPVRVEGERCDFELFSVHSPKLSELLAGCEQLVIFAATVGLGIDKLVNKYSSSMPSRALMLQAVGTERVEALCDALCENLRLNFGEITPRFSPGYGDVSLSVQKDLLSALEAAKHIGVSLNDSFLMTPTKSVTAFVGLRGKI